MINKAIIKVEPLGFLFPVSDPFLFCAHHLDKFPPGNEDLGPAASLQGRNIGNDFTIKDGWRMYHGDKVPGFPEHPHRGMETVTIVLEGFVDHADSHGQAGRYGNGDVQWMTAGAGLQHSEMFPLLNRKKDNPGELFQVWLNLPQAKKFAPPYFKMFWSENIPVHTTKDENGRSLKIILIAGQLGTLQALPPSPDSWAADPLNEVAIWLITMEARSHYVLKKSKTNVNRTIYFYRGERLFIQGGKIDANHAVSLNADLDVELMAGENDCHILLLQGKPIQEPVVQYGPFVMNTEQEIREAYRDYQKTEFGGWPWPRQDMVHPRNKGRFAKNSDGKEEVGGL